ncbi:hypothetical protein EON65_44985 [archaeon]|nr:MAG: hypothetical protein EON65_44985 [archaeon]
MSWIPILGGALGNTLGGVLSDRWVKAAESSNFMTGLSVRPLVCCLSNLIALPLIAVSFFLPSPACFLIYIGSGAVGEVYLSQSLALITDAQIAPGHLTPPSVALFMMVVTLIGGNAPLFIPTLLPLVGFNQDVTLTISAKGSDPNESGDVQYNVDNTDSKQLQYSLLYSLSACYGGAAVLYLLAFWMMRKDKGRNATGLNAVV